MDHLAARWACFHREGSPMVEEPGPGRHARECPSAAVTRATLISEFHFLICKMESAKISGLLKTL